VAASGVGLSDLWTRRPGGARVVALAGGVAVGLHGLLAFGLAVVDPKQFHPERPIEIAVEERLPPPEVKPPPPEIKPPPVEPPKPRVVRRVAQMTEPQPIPPAPPPPNQEAPPKQEATPVFGGSLSSVVSGDANVAIPVGNTLMTKPTTARTGEAKPYSGEGTRAFVPVADLYIAKYPEVICPDAPELYPDEAKKMGLEGVVRFKLGIDEQGKLVSIKIVERAGHGFDEAATKAMQQCKIKPAVSNDGRPVPCTHSWGYRFELGQ
jgi:periplasmic protein TonB